MNLILEGIVLGLTLMIMLGPLFVALTQASVQGGTRAGMTVAVGIWFSDFCIILASYLFVQKLSTLVEDHSFIYWMGLGGGFILIVFGIGVFLKKTSLEQTGIKPRLTKRNYLGYFTKGFLVNTLNPFTFGVWISVISTYLLGRKVSNQDALIFFGTVLIVIITTDTLKVLLAKLIRNRLTADHINLFSKIAGIVLMVFGVVLLLRVGVF